MATRAQIEANRRNAKLSAGPRTDKGKLKVRQNALRHGLCAGLPLMADENDENVQLLLEALREEHDPVGATEEILVYKMAEHFFHGKRAGYLIAELFDALDGGDKVLSQANLMVRYQTGANNGFLKSLNELRKLQKQRYLDGIGFVSQSAGAQPAAPPGEPAAPPEPRPEPPADPPVGTTAPAADTNLPDQQVPLHVTPIPVAAGETRAPLPQTASPAAQTRVQTPQTTPPTAQNPAQSPRNAPPAAQTPAPMPETHGAAAPIPIWRSFLRSRT